MVQTEEGTFTIQLKTKGMGWSTVFRPYSKTKEEAHAAYLKFVAYCSRTETFPVVK